MKLKNIKRKFALFPGGPGTKSYNDSAAEAVEGSPYGKQIIIQRN